MIKKIVVLVGVITSITQTPQASSSQVMVQPVRPEQQIQSLVEPEIQWAIKDSKKKGDVDPVLCFAEKLDFLCKKASLVLKKATAKSCGIIVSSVGDLKTRYAQKAGGRDPAPYKKPSVTMVRGFDAAKLSKSKYSYNSIQQVASQFNFLEAVGPKKYMSPRDYAKDKTQGPRASLGAPTSLIIRDYFVRHEGLGQQPVLESLGEPFYQRGYLQLGLMSEAEQCEFKDSLASGLDNLRVLSQDGTQFYADHSITQVFVAAPSFQGYAQPTIDSVAGQVCRDLIVCAYEHTARLAVIKSVETGKEVNVHLTKLGQGAFNCPSGVMSPAFDAYMRIVSGYNIRTFVHVFREEEVQITQNQLNEVGLMDLPIMSAEEFLTQAHS